MAVIADYLVLLRLSLRGLLYDDHVFVRYFGCSNSTPQIHDPAILPGFTQVLGIDRKCTLISSLRKLP